MIRDFLLSLAALPASSRISAERSGKRKRGRGQHRHKMDARKGDRLLTLENGGKIDGGTGTHTLGIVLF